MISLYSVFKTRDITLWTKIHIAEAMVFLIVMYGCDSWTIKKAEWQTTEAFKLWCWRRDLRVLWTARRSIHSVLKELNPKYSLEELITEAEAPILWPPNMKSWLTGKYTDVGKNRRQEEKGMTEDKMDGWYHRFSGHEFEKLWEMMKIRVLGVAKSWSLMSH